MKNDNIIRFYLIATKLKEKLRAGWIAIGIEKDRTESVAEHIYGTLILAIAIDSEYKLNLDMYKVLKILVLHELEETFMPDYTFRSKVSLSERKVTGEKCVHKATLGLFKQEEIEQLLIEFNERKTREAKFCYLIDKLECDFQAKVYDLQGVMNFEKSRENLKYYGKRALEIDKNSKVASDYWIEFDKPKFEDDPIFKQLMNDFQKLNKETYISFISEKN